SPQEVDLLVSMRRRRRAERWAARHGALARMAMRDLIQTAVELGMDRHSVLFGKPTAKTRRRERELLERRTAERRRIGPLAARVVRPEHPRAVPARAAEAGGGSGSVPGGGRAP